MSKKESWRSHIAKRKETRWTPEACERQSWLSREQVIAQGGVPNAAHFKPGENRGYKIQKGQFAGEKHPLWKGGISAINSKGRLAPGRKEWIAAVMVRDSYTCQSCKASKTVSGKLHAHHVKKWSDYPELRFDVDNGITLCYDCHLQIVHKGVWANKPLTREELNWLISQDAVSIDWAA